MVAVDKAYDSEDNHLLVREQLDAFTLIQHDTKKDIPIWNRWKIQKTNK